MKLTSTLFMKWLFAASLFLLTTTGQLHAQDSCTFRLRLIDLFGDGWDGSQVYLKLGNSPERSFTQNGTSRTDTVTVFDFRVKNGDSIVIRYTAEGDYQDEIIYSLLNNVGEVLFKDGPDPRTGVVFRTIAKCKNCGTAVNPVVTSFRASNATLRWQSTANGFQPTYLVEWDTAGFAYGRGRNRSRTTDTMMVLANLTELVKYTAFIQTVCFGNDSSNIVGPITFQTDTATDVGVTAILNPVGSCNLGVDSIKIIITNIGGAPQQLITYKASVNGQAINIPFPADGLYTGVLSKDSSRTLAFKSPFDFSAPGEYDIAAWTEVANDKNRKNDSTRVLVTKPRNITSYPYATDFELSKDTWSVYDSLKNSTWQWANPRWNVIKGSASGTKSWTTWADSSYRNNEHSFVVSPCYNFSTFTADPRITFHLNVNTEGGFDGLYLERSFDDGRTWSPIGRRRTGVNWYNDSIGVISRATWGGVADSTSGWRVAQNILDSVKGRQNVRFRFGFRADGSNVADGVAIDNINISSVPAIDLAAQRVRLKSVTSCTDSIVNSITLNFSNLGTAAQTGYTVNYQINNGAVISETVATAIAANQTISYTLTRGFKTVVAGDYNIKAWITVASDVLRRNDTVTATVRIGLEKPLQVNTYPYFENFESGTGTWSVLDSLNTTWGYVTAGSTNNTFINTAASGTKFFKSGATPTGTYNNNEWGYLYSPCYDFSRFTVDPRMSFSLNVHSEARFDGAWLEGSQDGGATWTRIGTRGVGVNWYNDTITAVQRGVWTGVTLPGWRIAQNTLTGYAGKTSCRFRFVFRSDASINATGGLPYGGFAVDNIYIGAPSSVDLATGGNTRVDLSNCGLATDSIRINITNVGTTRQFRYQAGYKVDNLAPVIENIDSLNINPGATATYTFRTPFNSTGFGNHTIQTWVRLIADTTLINDTLSSRFLIPLPIGVFTSYNFNNGAAPQYWTQTGNFSIGLSGHGNPVGNGYAQSNIWSLNKVAQLFTHRFGPVKAKDSISYDYRFVNFSSPFAAYNFNQQDTLYVGVAVDCSPIFTIVDLVSNLNHTPTTEYTKRKFSLARWEGLTVRVGFRIVSAATSADYYIDLDNINYLACPENLNLTASIRNTRAGQSGGSVAVTPTAGIAPYTYLWNNGRTTDSIGGLTAGNYTVTVTDGRGCLQTQTFVVVNTVGTFDPSSPISRVQLAPNPTTGNATVTVELNKPTEARVQVLNLMGQLLYETRNQGNTLQEQQFELDLANKPAGVYLIRVTADSRSHVVRLVKQ